MKHTYFTYCQKALHNLSDTALWFMFIIFVNLSCYLDQEFHYYFDIVSSCKALYCPIASVLLTNGPVWWLWSSTYQCTHALCSQRSVSEFFVDDTHVWWLCHTVTLLSHIIIKYGFLTSHQHTRLQLGTVRYLVFN